MGQVLFPTLGGPTSQDLCFLPALFPAAQLQNLEEISCGSGITNRGGDWHFSLKAAKTVVLPFSSCQALLSCSISELRVKSVN